MALFGSFGGILNNAFGAISGVSGSVGGIGQVGSAFLTPLLAQGPVVRTLATAPRVAGAVGKAGARIFTGRSMVSALVGGILVKIATTLGRNSMSIRGALKIVRRMGKFLEPAAIAVALGITVSELAELIMAGASMPRRRMNPGNTNALRRAARRIESFHRLCVRTDQLRSPRRRSTRRAAAAGHGPTIVQAR